ncbi:MAG: hypothetical protein ACREMX_17130 [Gemmatimonadales bacterium]
MAHGSFLERARHEREHDCDTSSRLALGGYLVARLVDQMLLAAQGPEARSGFLWQLDAVRRHVHGLPVDVPEAAHLCGITDAVPVDKQPLSGLRLSLTAYAYFLEHEGRLDEALDILMLAARTHGSELPPADFAATALFAGRLNRVLARWDVATRCYQGAEQAGRLAHDPVAALRGQLGCGAVLRGQGNLPRAREVAEGVVAEAGSLRLADVQAMAYIDLGAVLVQQGLPVEAVQAKYQAFRLTEDNLQRMHYLGDLGVGLSELGEYEGARTAFELVVASNTSFLVRTNAVLELMELESVVNNRMAFERRRADAEAVRERMPPSMTADFHFKAGVSLARFGSLARAREFLGAGMQLAEAHHLNAWYFRFERVLSNLAAGCGSREPEHAEPVAQPQSPAVQEVAVGLREYALLAT